jgi:hypothetical protein
MDGGRPLVSKLPDERPDASSGGPKRIPILALGLSLEEWGKRLQESIPAIAPQDSLRHGPGEPDSSRQGIGHPAGRESPLEGLGNDQHPAVMHISSDTAKRKKLLDRSNSSNAL